MLAAMLACSDVALGSRGAGAGAGLLTSRGAAAGVGNDGALAVVPVEWLSVFVAPVVRLSLPSVVETLGLVGGELVLAEIAPSAGCAPSSVATARGVPKPGPPSADSNFK